MVFIRVLLFTSILQFSVALDFIRESLRIVDQSSDPCDDFFRHACPRGNFKYLVDMVYDKYRTDFFKNREPRAWDNLKSAKALEKVQLLHAESPISTIEYLVKFFYGQCVNLKDTTPILAKLEEIIEQTKNPACHQMSCLKILSADENCTRSATSLRERLEQFLLNPLRSPEHPDAYLYKLSEEFKDLFSSINAISLIIGDDIREGIITVNKFITDMIDIVKEMILETPWLKNYDLETFTHKVASDVKLAENYAEALETSLNLLMKLELHYLDCMSDTVKAGDRLCLIYAHRLTKIGVFNQKFYDFYNAFNDHPLLLFGIPVFHIAQHAAMAGKIGFSGMVAGHELSHTLIENPNDRELFPIYSEPAIECVQDQFRASCAEYKENVCDVEDLQIDDNGADILGAQLSYKLLEKYMGNQLKEEYMELNQISITNEQLFFYAAAFTFCQGEPAGTEGDDHAAGNVRVNSLAQLPAFQEAFNCSSDSRIMKTVKEQCFIFGKDAPAQRRK